MEKVQLRVLAPIASCAWTRSELRVGDIVWVRPAEAAHLISIGLCEYAGARLNPGGDDASSVVVRPSGWPVDRFSVVRPIWRGDVVLCIGGGPSVTTAALKAAEGRCRAIAVNNSYLLAPWADVLYFADHRWWKWHSEGVRCAGLSKEEVSRRFREFAGVRVTIENTGGSVPDPSVHLLRHADGDGLSFSPNALKTGLNSGYQAINFAVLAGARKVLLLGYDMRFPEGRSHWHEGHPERTPEWHYKSGYAKKFKTMLSDLAAAGTEVVNCSPGSAISCFRFSTVEAELSRVD